MLLDTNVLLWWMGEPSRIERTLLADLKDAESVVLFSQVSLLEIQIKAGLGKLHLDFPVEHIRTRAQQRGDFHSPETAPRASRSVRPAPDLRGDPTGRPAGHARRDHPPLPGEGPVVLNAQCDGLPVTRDPCDAHSRLPPATGVRYRDRHGCWERKRGRSCPGI